MYWMKKTVKVLNNPYSANLGDTEPPSMHKMYNSRIFEDRFVEKEGSLRIYNQSTYKVAGGLEVFLFR
jgi:hypothetical protein